MPDTYLTLCFKVQAPCNDGHLVYLPNCRISFRKGLFSFPTLINTHCFLDSYTDFAMSGKVVVQDYPCAQG